MTDLFPDGAVQVSIERQIGAAKRELAYRRHVYPRLITNGKMTQAKAATEIQIMKSIVATLEQVRDKERPA